MWTEPLVPRINDLGEYRFAVKVTDGDGVTVAEADALVNRRAGCGYLAELRIVAEGGGARQKRRALVLLVREACRHAQALGVTQAHTETTAALRAFGERLAGRGGVRAGERYRIEGDLAELRSNVLAVTDAEGAEETPAETS